jgi:hypothetical protein
MGRSGGRYIREMRSDRHGWVIRQDQIMGIYSLLQRRQLRSPLGLRFGVVVNMQVG